MDDSSGMSADIVFGSPVHNSKKKPAKPELLDEDDDEEGFEDFDYDGLDTCLHQPLYPTSTNQLEMDYMVSLALATLEDCTPDHLHVVCTHLNGLQPDLTTERLARSLLSFVINSGERRGAMERRLIALVQLLSKAEWPDLECIVVATVPDSLTSPDGPSADDHAAVALGRLAAWLCLLRSNRAELLRMLAEILGRGGPRTAPACFGALHVWPAVLGTENLSCCISFCIERVIDSKDDDYTEKLKECLELNPFYETQDLDALKDKLLKESKTEMPPSLCFSLRLLSRIFGPPLVVSDVIDFYLLPIINGTHGEDEHAAATAVVLMGLISRDLAFGRSKGRLVARRYILAAILEVLEDDDLSWTMLEAVAIALVAAVGAGRPKLLENVLEKVPAARVTPAFKRRLIAWSLQNLQPVFPKRKRKRKCAEDDDNEQQDSQDLKCPPFTYKELVFPETIKELLNFDDPAKIQLSECRYTIEEDDEGEF